MSNFYHYLSTVTGIDEVYFYLILTTALVVIIFILIKRLAEFIVKRSVPLLKQYSVNQTVQMIINLLFVIIMFFVWDNYIKNIITLISIIGASLIVALREGILSFVGGLYIRVKRLFVTGDRIQIDDIIGDVIEQGGIKSHIRVIEHVARRVDDCLLDGIESIAVWLRVGEE